METKYKSFKKDTGYQDKKYLGKEKKDEWKLQIQEVMKGACLLNGDA